MDYGVSIVFYENIEDYYETMRNYLFNMLYVLDEDGYIDPDFKERLNKLEENYEGIIVIVNKPVKNNECPICSGELIKIGQTEKSVLGPKHFSDEMLECSECGFVIRVALQPMMVDYQKDYEVDYEKEKEKEKRLKELKTEEDKEESKEDKDKESELQISVTTEMCISRLIHKDSIYELLKEKLANKTDFKKVKLKILDINRVGMATVRITGTGVIPKKNQTAI
jgi:hypothetical protein